MKNILLLIVVIAITSSSFAQIGVNTTAPDSSAILDLNANNKGLLIPTMTTTQRVAMQASSNPTIANGLLVFDTDYKRFYYWDTAVTPKCWVVLNNWRKEYTQNNGDAEHITIMFDPAKEQNSNVGIGQDSPTSKLTVNGNLTVGSNAAAPNNGAYVEGSMRIGSGAGNTAKLEIQGNTTTTGTSTANQFVGKGTLPINSIVLWYGNTSTIPTGWAICDGSLGTPNLKNRFVVGADPAESTSNDGDNFYNWKDTGGENTHKLLESEMPQHKHPLVVDSHNHTTSDKYSAGKHSKGIGADEVRDDRFEYRSVTSSSVTVGITMGNTGEDGYHENRPPYYALYYIMRIN